MYVISGGVLLNLSFAETHSVRSPLQRRLRFTKLYAYAVRSLSFSSYTNKMLIP